MIDYPNKLNIIFEKLDFYKIRPIIVGGYIRDKLLNLDSKDIDIELYGLDSLEVLEDILAEYGSLNSVGKSFGVCKLSFKELEIDFSLPRRDSKIASGHKGFDVSTDKNLDFKTAASRRDFTINSMGYDVLSKNLLDPFCAQADLKTKTLRAVDIKKFDEDPLRVLRAVGFSTRFGFRLDEELFTKCKSMINAGVLEELPSERILEEFKKLLLKSKNPSKGFLLLQKLDAFLFFNEFDSLTKELFTRCIKSLDYLAECTRKDEKEIFVLMLALLCRYFKDEDIKSFLNKLTQEVKIHKDLEKFIKIYKKIDINKCTNYDIYLLASKIEIRSFLFFLNAATLGEHTKELQDIKEKAKSLGVYTKAMPALLQGKDLLILGLTPSKKFSTLLEKSYKAQMQELFKTKKDALIWFRKNLLA